MSVALKISKIKPERQSEMIKYLTMTPEVTSYTQKKYKTKPESIKMFKIENDVVRIPYSFAKAYFKRDFNEGDKAEIEVGEFKGVLRDYQQEVYDEAKAHIKEHRTTSLILYTGFGKTFICCKLIHEYKLLTCVLFHLTTLPPQWIKELTSTTGIDKSEIWVVGKKRPKNVKIIFCMYGQVSKISEEERNNVGMLMIDEAHRFSSKTRVDSLLAFKPRYIVAATATPDSKEDGMYDMMNSIVGYHKIERKDTKPFHCFIIDTGIVFDLETEQPFTELSNLQAESVERNDIVLDVIKQNEEWYSMIICRLIKMIKNLAEGCEKIGLDCDTLKSTDKDYDGDKKILIGSLMKMGVGFDQANYCSNFKEKSKLTVIGTTFAKVAAFRQALGRGTRHDDPYIVLLRDNNSISKRHISKMKKWVKEAKGVIHNIKYKKGMNLKLDTLI